MSKLISMTEFVLDYAEVLTVVDNFKDVKHTLNKIFNYANFLSQPLTLGMFVPCDENGKVINEPDFNSNDDCFNWTEYNNALDKVLFNNFEIKGRVHKDGFFQLWLIGVTAIAFENLGRWIFYPEYKTIEDLAKYNLTLKK
jgi:hypothetical protein